GVLQESVAYTVERCWKLLNFNNQFPVAVRTADRMMEHVRGEIWYVPDLTLRDLDRVENGYRRMYVDILVPDPSNPNQVGGWQGCFMYCVPQQISNSVTSIMSEDVYAAEWRNDVRRVAHVTSPLISSIEELYTDDDEVDAVDEEE